MSEEFPFQKAHDAIVSMLHDYLAEKEHSERLESENAILMKRTALLMDEVERLRASSFVTAVPSHQYERIVKAGDAMASMLQFEETLNDSDRIPQSVQTWNAAKNGWDDAKEGKPGA